MMHQTRRMTKTVKNMRLRSHQSYLLWSQELSLRGIKTSPLLLPRWPIRNLCPQYRSCLQPTTSTSTSTSPGNEPSHNSRPPRPPPRTGPRSYHPKHLLRLPGISCRQAFRMPPTPFRLCLQVSCFHQYHDKCSISCFLLVDH